MRNLIACRLCWRITFVVFGLILAVESAILIPSALRFQTSAHERLAHAAQVTVEPVLMLGSGLNSTGLLTRDLAPLVDMYGIKGIAIYRSGGERVTSVGSTPPPGFPAKPSALNRIAGIVANASEDATLDVGWSSDAPGSPVAVVRIDAGSVTADLAAYLLLQGQVSVRLRRAMPQQFVAHFGGERFALVNDTLGCDVTGVSRLAETLLREVGGTYEVGGGNSVSLALRVGIARSTGAVTAGRALLDQAELALAGTTAPDGPHYLFYSAQLAEASRERQSLARDLKHAIDAGELYPVFQPKMALTPEGGTVLAGAEVLLRWNHATRGMVRPDVFIALAESTGLMTRIGDFVLRAAAQVIRNMLDRHGWAPPLAVNLSAQQFADAALVSQITQVLADAKIPAHLLELEITETAAMKDAERTAQVLVALRAIGVRVAIDDFGTGYSSLSYLRRFAVDAIKIDKSFVDDIGTDANAEAVCDAILRLGQSLHTKIVAEGVENSCQLAFLRARRCDEVQGYLFSKPVSLSAFERDWVAVHAVA